MCPVEEKAKIDICESDQWVAGFDSANFRRAEHRDTQAIHAKLDELLRAEGRARSELTRLDDEEPEVIEQHRSEERKSLG